MRINENDLNDAALQLWVEIFKAQCSLPRVAGEAASVHVHDAERVADVAERTFRERCAKEAK